MIFSERRQIVKNESVVTPHTLGRPRKLTNRSVAARLQMVADRCFQGAFRRKLHPKMSPSQENSVRDSFLESEEAIDIGKVAQI